MRRYAVISDKIPREMLLLRGLPCAWGGCTFCDYIEDNTPDPQEAERVARIELAKVTGQFGRLEVINSGSILELPESVRILIRQTIQRRNIQEFICESHWMYRNRFEQIRDFFGIPTRIKVGVETFDEQLRNQVLAKNMVLHGPEELARYTDSICLLVGFKGQTRELVRTDVQIMRQLFRFGCVNIYNPGPRHQHLEDRQIKEWFRTEFAYLQAEPNIELLWNNTDLGVG